MSLSPEERAEQIIRGIGCVAPSFHKQSLEYTARIIREVEAEAKLCGLNESFHHQTEDIKEAVYNQGRREALEEAAKIADGYPMKAGLSERAWATPNVCITIAERIRALIDKKETA